jgi:acetyl esterase/lipase
MVYFPTKQGEQVKGAVLVCAGGAFQFRNDRGEGTPVAEYLSKLGYQSFVVNYRLRPYTMQEGALNLARAASPVTYVDENDPPFLIIHGEKDELISPDQSRLLSSWLSEKGIQNEFSKKLSEC